MGTLIALAVGPGFLLLHLVYAFDRHDKEPWRNVGRYVLLGAAAGLLAALVEVGWQRFLPRSASVHPVAVIVAMFLGVALVEEGAKYALLRFGARRDRHITEPFDWVVYGVTVALGFATLENLAYVLPGGWRVGLLRAALAVPAHALDGTLMGDRLARAAVATDPVAARRERRLAVIEPTLWHGAYDSLAVGSVIFATDAARTACVAGFALLVLAQWVVAARRVRRHWRVVTEKRVPPILYPLHFGRSAGGA